MNCIANCIVSSLVFCINDNIVNDLGFKRDMDPGPIDDSVLTMQALHRSTRVWNGPVVLLFACLHIFIAS
ncbi:hypothetical protein Scep_015088 [Stephania cephalantha]|uniref:Uncharacterized protein n=1 Tax=Stephania cephalantha TaxID=152367 RepID=A0AAP0J4N9_9MAGN